MDEMTDVNFSAFVSRLSPSAFACFRVLFENAREKIMKEGPQGTYEKALAELMDESGSNEIESVANSIREIIQCKVDCKEGEYLYFFPFLTSISIEGGIIRYSLPREIENAMLQIPVPCPST